MALLGLARDSLSGLLSKKWKQQVLLNKKKRPITCNTQANTNPILLLIHFLQKKNSDINTRKHPVSKSFSRWYHEQRVWLNIRLYKKARSNNENMFFWWTENHHVYFKCSCLGFVQASFSPFLHCTIDINFPTHTRNTCKILILLTSTSVKWILYTLLTHPHYVNYIKRLCFSTR